MSDHRFKVTPPKLRVVGWPGVLGDIARIMGDEVTMKFAWEFGDRKLHIPRPNRLSKQPEHPLIKALGFEEAMKLADAFGGRDYTVPTGRHAMNFHRARTFRAHGWPIRAIAIVTRLRKETVKILCEDVEPSQGDPLPVTAQCPSCGTVHTYHPPQDNEGNKSRPNAWWAENRKNQNGSPNTE